ncbi:MAG: transcriptional regulator TrmB [Candidatus Kerfeldbacteria bacterium]|nr:transcriptional regulator TrmB [Candidatus Kerfeldbacteria bacterium]
MVAKKYPVLFGVKQTTVVGTQKCFATQHFAFTKRKISHCLELLQLGRATASELGVALNIPRTTALEILTQLQAQGLVISTTSGRKRLFSATTPQHLEQHFSYKAQVAHSLLPDLLSLFQGDGTKPTVRVFEGLNGVRRVFEETLHTKNKLLRGVLSMEDLYAVPGKKFMDSYIAKRIAKGIQLQVVRSHTKEVEEIWPSSAQELRELRYAPKQYTFPMTIYVFNKTVALLGTKKEPFGVLIQSEGLATTMQNFFDLLWSVSQVTKKKG